MLTAREITNRGGRATFIPCDVSNSVEVKAAVAKTVDAGGGIDVLVNNAGVPGVLVPVVDLPEDEWERVIAVNLGGVYRFFTPPNATDPVMYEAACDTVNTCTTPPSGGGGGGGGGGRCGGHVCPQ